MFPKGAGSPFYSDPAKERKLKKLLGNLVEGACMVLVVALAVIVFLQVFNRFVLKAPLAWSEDLAMETVKAIYAAYLSAEKGMRVEL